MKFPNQFNFYKFFVISAITIGVGFFLFSLIFTRMVYESEEKSEMPRAEPKRAIVSESSQPSTVQTAVQNSKLPSEADIEAVIAALENMDTTNGDEGVESYWDEENSETPLTDSLNKTPLSYEQELKQRYWRIRKTPEYKELIDKINAVELDLELWYNLETPAQDAWVAFLKNPYSVYGLTETEADKMELTDEQHEFISQENRRLEQEMINERNQREVLYQENRRQRAELDQQVYGLLGMTQEEVLTVLGRR